MFYAHFMPENGAILNWIDTEAFHYPELPPASQLLALSPAQWATRNEGKKAVINGALVDAPAAAAPSLADRKAALLRKLNQTAQAIADQLTASYPEFEKLTWEDQKREAKAWEADSSAPTPYIDRLAELRGIPRGQYLSRTLEKIDAFANAAQTLVGLRQKYADQVNAATAETIDAVESMAFVFDMN